LTFQFALFRFLVPYYSIHSMQILYRAVSFLCGTQALFLYAISIFNILNKFAR